MDLVLGLISFALAIIVTIVILKNVEGLIGKVISILLWILIIIFVVTRLLIS